MAVLSLITIISYNTKVIAMDNNVAGTTPVTINNEEYVRGLAEKYSEKYNISFIKLFQTLKNENTSFDFSLQSGLKYKAGNRWGFPAGTREKSYGVAQIHLPDHPEITYEQAIDPDFSVEYMAKEFALGHEKQWMGYQG